MSLRYGVLIFLFLSFGIFLGLKIYGIWTFPIKFVPGKGETKKSGVNIESPSTVGDKKEPTPIEDFNFVAEKNIFRPDRKEFPITPDPTKEKKPIVRPQITLFGVMIAGEYRSASVSQAGRVTQKGERETLTVKIGDQIGGYKLTKILSDRIGLEAPEDSFEVFLYDARAPKKRIYAKTENKPATVTSTLSTPTPTGAPSPTPPGGAAPGRPVTERVTETRAPGPVTPASVPTTRRRGPETSIPASEPASEPKKWWGP